MSDALETVRVVEASGVKFIHGTCNRLAPMVKMAKRMCPDPLYSFCQCTDTVTNQACHNIDLAVNLFHESPLAAVYASGVQAWDLDPHLPVDSFAAVLTFADKSVHTYLQHGRAYNALLTKYHYQLFGKDRCVFLAKRFKECHLMKDLQSVERTWSFSGPDMDRGPFGYMGHYDELKELVDCIRSGRGNGTMTVRDAAYILAVEKAILQSTQTGQAVAFPEFLKANHAAFLSAQELTMHPGVNLEFARSAGLSFEESLEAARQAGYAYVEPYVYSETDLRHQQPSLPQERERISSHSHRDCRRARHPRTDAAPGAEFLGVRRPHLAPAAAGGRAVPDEGH